jgi:hypothetical protein
MRTQVAFDLVAEDTQGSFEGFAVMVKVIAQPLLARCSRNRPWCRVPVRTSCPAVRSAAVVHWTTGRSSTLETLAYSFDNRFGLAFTGKR